ncbi:hypothetical protein GVAV_003548 [Gurleya vavrai]
MFNYELENVLKKNEKEFNKIESEAQCNVIVFFSFDDDKLVFKSITEFKNDLFSKLNIEDTGKSIMAIKHDIIAEYLKSETVYYLKRLFKKIEKKLENNYMEISDISPDRYFGIIIESTFDTNNKNNKQNNQINII